jgi:hypothetical protein
MHNSFMEFLLRDGMRCRKKRHLLPVSAKTVPIHVLLLLWICGTDRITCEHNNSHTLKAETVPCGGTNPCASGSQVGQPNTSAGHVLSDIVEFPMKPSSAAGFGPDEPCPTTDILETDTDLRVLENQVNLKTFQ